jgi:hypothetical protein
MPPQTPMQAATLVRLYFKSQQQIPLRALLTYLNIDITGAIDFFDEFFVIYCHSVIHSHFLLLIGSTVWKPGASTQI